MPLSVVTPGGGLNNSLIINYDTQGSMGKPSVVVGTEPNAFCAALPTFNLQSYLEAVNKGDVQLMELCRALADCLKQTGSLVVRDPRVDGALNDKFLSLMERYFSQPSEIKMADARPHLAYQVGATPEGIERPRCLKDPSILANARKLAPEHQPAPPMDADVKWRFFWRVGERPKDTRYAELNAEPVIPAAFPEWAEVMDEWGCKMLDTVKTVAEMVALGFGLETNAFTRLMELGPHLLAPTGVDIQKHGRLNTVFAGYHYDLNFLTIHGKSRFPGLHIWLRNGERVAVTIPDGCLLLQAGKQMEWLTGGAVEAGYHEVLCTSETIKAAERAMKEGRPAWRVSSTVFSQIASDAILEPLGCFDNATARRKYPPIPAGKYVQDELEIINLRSPF